jgi:hypothetical protein
MGIPTGRKGDGTDPTVTVTREVRWFRGGAVPRAILEWFTDGVRVHRERRRDRYDPMTANLGIGLKYRGEADFDAKYLMSPESVEQLADGVVGRVGDWVKVSRPVSGSKLIREELITVHKSLRTRVYMFEVDGVAAGCEVELGDLTTSSGPAWSLCLETIGPAEHRHAALRFGVDRFLAETPLPSRLAFTVADSCAYPQWLTQRRIAA